jgi:ABC-2 type transport system permease protein
MRAMLARVWALTIKEFLALLKDKRSRLVLIVPPLMQLMVFGYAATFDLNDVPYALYNQDPGQASRELVAYFKGSKNFQLHETLSSEMQIAPLVESGEVLMALVIHPHFTKDLLLGNQGRVQVIIDGRNSNTALVLLGYVQNIVGQFSQEWLRANGGNPAPSQLEVRAWFNPNLESRWFIVPGIAGLLTLVVSLLVTSLSVAREREAGTFDQLLVTPLRPVEILMGKALPGLIIGFAEATAIIVAGVLWFEVPLLGSLFALYLGLFLFLLSALGVGLMISSFSYTQQQSLLGTFLFMVPAVILSGFATPIANMPQIVQTMTLANPLRYFLVVLRRVFLEGAGVNLLWDQYWPMAVIGLVSLAAANLLFHKRVQ